MFFWRNENSRQILPATLSLTAAHSLSPIGREVAGLSITDQEDQGRGRSPEAGNACWWMRVISRQAIRVDEVMTRNSCDGELLSKRPLARSTKAHDPTQLKHSSNFLPYGSYPQRILILMWAEKQDLSWIPLINYQWLMTQNTFWVAFLFKSLYAGQLKN